MFIKGTAVERKGREICRPAACGRRRAARVQAFLSVAELCDQLVRADARRFRVEGEQPRYRWWCFLFPLWCCGRRWCSSSPTATMDRDRDIFHLLLGTWDLALGTWDAGVGVGPLGVGPRKGPQTNYYRKVRALYCYAKW